MIHFVFIRHGETLWTKQKRYQGSTNTQLTARGRKQIQRFVKKVTAYQPDVIFSSSLDRCKESAGILCDPLKMKPTVDARLNELNFGKWEGKTAQELVEAGDKDYDRWIKGTLVKPKGGESTQSLRRRVKAFVDHCIKKYDNKKIIVVTHGGALRMFLIELLKLPVKDAFKFRIDPGTMTIVGCYAYSTQLVLFNSSSPKKGLVPYECV